MAKEISVNNFEKEVLQSDKPVLLDFWANWCGPCKMLTPVIEQLSSEYDGKAVVGKVNVDEQNELAQKYNVMSIPNVVVIHKGEVVENLVGYREIEDFKRALDKYIQ